MGKGADSFGSREVQGSLEPALPRLKEGRRLTCLTHPSWKQTVTTQELEPEELQVGIDAEDSETTWSHSSTVVCRPPNKGIAESAGRQLCVYLLVL